MQEFRQLADLPAGQQCTCAPLRKLSDRWPPLQSPSMGGFKAAGAEVQICISGFTQATPYVFDDAHPSLLRLLTRSADGSTASQVSPARVPVLSTRAAWQGQTWTGVRWPRSTWTDTRELIGSRHSTQS